MDSLFFIGVGVITFSLISILVVYIKEKRWEKANIYRLSIGLIAIVFSVSEILIKNESIIKGITLICCIITFILVFFFMKKYFKEN